MHRTLHVIHNLCNFHLSSVTHVSVVFVEHFQPRSKLLCSDQELNRVQHRKQIFISAIFGFNETRKIYISFTKQFVDYFQVAAAIYHCRVGNLVSKLVTFLLHQPLHKLAIKAVFSHKTTQRDSYHSTPTYSTISCRRFVIWMFDSDLIEIVRAICCQLFDGGFQFVPNEGCIAAWNGSHSD